MKTIPESEWRWDGHAGHFIGASACRFHLHTRIGNYRVSTVGDWYPTGWDDDDPKQIGAARTHETFVFRVTGHAEGEVEDYNEIASTVYRSNDCEAARAGHMDMCRKYAVIAAAEAVPA